ncbi:MAG: hypothetical protein JWP00_3401 [Chloroflexi bacterium]|jgi:hypothetical protein|nr:hypothetical protein [Chloroflexota bacterium]
MEDIAVALRVLIAAAKTSPENADVMWQAARLLLNSPAARQVVKMAEEFKNPKNETSLTPAEPEMVLNFGPVKAEFDYLDETGLYTHRTVYVMALIDGRDIKRNENLPPADRYGYLLTGYCTLRKQIRSFRSSRISNLRTFTEGKPLQANRQWKTPQIVKMAS